MATDDVRLTDLAVIQQFSLAVRGATASRAAVIAALRSDLDWLTAHAEPAPAAPSAASPASARSAAPATPGPAKRRTRKA